LKKYLGKKGIRIGAIVLAVVLLIALGAHALGGRAGFFQNMSGALKRPVQNVVGSVADWLQGIYGYMYKYDDLKAENESLRSQLAKAQEQAREAQEATEENDRLRNLLGFKEKHTDYDLESAKIIAARRPTGRRPSPSARAARTASSWATRSLPTPASSPDRSPSWATTGPPSAR
jgi:cell shape-determining protein MreC